MSTLVEIECPHCQASLKLKSRQPLGKKVPCPKCRKPFVAKEKVAAAAPPPVSSAVDDYDAAPVKTRDPFDDAFGGIGADEGFDDLAPAPSETRRKKKPKKKGMPAGLKWSLIGGGAVFGLAAVGIAIWLVIGMFFKKLDLAYLPPDAKNISSVRYAEIWNSSLAQEGMKIDDGVKKKAAEMKEKWGIEPKDIVSVTKGSSSEESLTVVRTSIDMDKDKILKNVGDYDEIEHEGKTVYTFGPSSALVFPDARTALSGSVDSVKKALERGPEVKERDDLSFVDGSYQVVEVHVRKSSFGLPGVFGRLGDRSEKQNSGKESLAYCFGYSYSSSMKFKGQGKFPSDEIAAKLVEEFRENIEQELKKWKESEREEARNNIKKHNPHNLSDKDIERMLDSQEASLRSASISRSGDIVTITVKSTPPKLENTNKIYKEHIPSELETLVAMPGQKLFGITDFGKFQRRNPINRNLGVNIPRPNPGINRGARVTVFDITVGNGRNGDEEAAKAVINGVNGIDAGRTTAINGRLRAYSKPGDNVRSSQIIAALRAAGFRSYRVSSRTE